MVRTPNQNALGMRKALAPSPRRAKPPPFSDMASEDFEEMCCALLDKEPGVTRADLYRTRYDKQYGIDAFADHPNGLIVQSDKCQGAVRKGQMAQWSKDFLDHWDEQWRERKVVKFILAVAADMNSKARLADIDAEAARFAEINVVYEVWAPRQLQERLRTQPGIVRQHLGSEEWVERLCDVVDDSASNQALVADLQDRLANLGGALGEQIRAQLDAIAQDVDRGLAGQLEATLAEIRSGPGWSTVPADQQARLVRLQGSAALNREDLAAAQAFSAEADSISPPVEPRLRAVIVWRTDGAKAALEALGAPKTDRGRALAAAMHLTLGEIAQAQDAVSAMDPDTSQALRLKGQLHLARGEIDTALATLQEAARVALDIPATQQALAIALYASALSPKIRPEMFSHPQPIAEALVRQDDASRHALEAALEAFDNIAAKAPAIEAREPDMAWALACRCLLRAPDASEAAQALLARWPTNIYGIGWTLARDLAVDLAPSRRALLAGLATGNLEVNGPRALEWLTPASERDALLAEVEAALATPLWKKDVARELVALKAHLTGQAPPQSAASEAGEAIEAAVQSQDWTKVEAAFEAQVREDPDSSLVLGLAETLANAGRWALLAEHAAIIESFETADSTTIVALAKLNAGVAAEAMAVIERGKRHFPGERLPYVLRRVEAEALAKIGDPVTAAERASALAQETNEPDDRQRQAKLLLDLGDARNATLIVEALLADDALTPADALEWAHRLVSENMTLAQILWRHAVRDELDDRLAASAYALAFNLNLEGERPDLGEAMQRLALAGDGAVRRVELDELVEQLREHRTRQAKLEDDWFLGRTTLHLLSEAAGVSLADLLDLQPDPAQRLRPVMVRSGARGVAPPDPAPITQWRLFLDVSALLVADHLDLLSILDDLDEPVRIPAAATKALRKIGELVRHNQPSRAQNAERVLAQLGENIGVVAPSEAWRVSHEADAEAFPRIIGLVDVLAALQAAGDVDAETVETLAPQLTPNGVRSIAPSIGQTLVFTDATLDRLAGASLLDLVLDRFEVFIDAPSLQLARQEASRARRGEILGARITRLRQTLARKLRSGVWVTVKGKPDSNTGKTALVKSLGQMLDAPEQDPQARVWFEDRLVSSFVAIGKVPIVQALDVLDALRSARLIDEAGYFDRLARLREGGALFIPFRAEEVVYHLIHARVHERAVIETPGLKAVRRNFGLSLIYERWLKLQDDDNDRPLEVDAVLAKRRLAQEAIQACWNSAAPADIAAAWSSWIWRALRTEHPYVPSPPPPQEGALPTQTPSARSAARDFTALNIAGLVSIAFSLKEEQGEPPRARRKAYFDWLEREVLGQRLDRDRVLRDAVVAVLLDVLRLDRAERLPPETHEMFRIYLAELTGNLPKPLRDAVGGDEEFMKSLGFGETLAITVGSASFRATPFWAAVEAAVNGRPNSLKSEEGIECSVRWSAEAPTRLEFPGLQAATTVAFVGLLSDEETIRLAALERLFVASETPPGSRGDFAAQLMALAPGERMSLADEASEANFKAYLHDLAAPLQANRSVTMDRFSPPSAQTLLRFMRWSAGGLAAAVSDLRAELSPTEALIRLLSLPFVIPPQAWAGVDPAALPMVTPMARIHRLRALRTGVITGPVDLEAETHAVAEAVAEWGDLFVTLLVHASLAFEGRLGWAALPAIDRHVCIWVFADRMTDMLAAVGSEPAGVIAALKRAQPDGSTSQALRLDDGYDNSALSAHSMKPEWLLLAGLEYALGEAADALQLSPLQLQALRNVLILETADGTTLIRPVRTLEATDPLIETWLNRPHPHHVLPDGADAEDLLEASIGTLERDPHDLPSWAIVYGYGPPVLTREQRPRLGEVIGKLDLPTLLSVENAPLHLLRLVADTVGRLSTDEASEAFLDKLVRFSEVFVPQVSAADFDDRLGTLMEAAAAAVRSYSDKGGERFFLFVRALLALRPDLATPLRPILDNLVDFTPIGEAGDFWRTLVQARAY